MIRLVNIHTLLILIACLAAPALSTAQRAWSRQQCIDTALAHNKSLQLDRNQIRIAEQRKSEAKSNLLPKVTANADYRYFAELPTQLMPMNIFNPQIPDGQFKSVKFGVEHNINANLQLAFPVYNPQIKSSIQNAEIALDISELQYKKTEEQVVFDITTLYYNAQFVWHQMRFVDSNLTNANKLLANTRLLREQLLARETDVRRVELRAQQLATQREKLQANYEQILNALKLNMGIALTTQLTIDPDITHAKSSGTMGDVLDLKLIEAKNELLIDELKTLQRLRHLPTVSLIAIYGTTGFGYNKSPNSFLKFYPSGFAGIQLSYPIFNGTTYDRKIVQKKLEIKNNELTHQLIADKNEMQIENALRQRAVTEKTIRDADDQISLANTIYQQIVLTHQQGLATLNDILSADNDLREARQNYLNVLVEYLKADLEYRRLTGAIQLQ